MQPRSALSGSEIAIIGMAGRFPGAGDLDRFWQNLAAGVESVARLSLEDWARAAGTHPALLERPDLVAARPRLDGIELFDAEFFGYTPRDAKILDPQQRLFLEVSWHALENAGYDSERYPGAIGVCAGVSQSSYLMNFVQWDGELAQTAGDLQLGLGNMNDSLATRVAYKLNLKGAAYAVQSFCSTSLVAVHLACQSLLNHENDMVLAGGATIYVSQDVGYRYQEGGIFSPDGHTRTFDAKGRGTIFGNGVGVVVLKRLKDALADGDNIRAVIRGTATNNDGSLKVGFTAPSVAGQAEVIVEALSAADVSPETIGYVEAHGTATPLGDPAEVAGLTKAWRKWTDKRQFCALGSVKTNVGHLDAAAGVAGLIKTALCLENEQIPASLHFASPNPQIDFENSPFYVNTALTPWLRGESPRRAGVSAFGIGGTNAHAIVEEAPALPATTPARPWQLLLLSAKTESALERATLDLGRHLEARPQSNLADVAFTLLVGRRVFNHRRAVVCRDVPDAVAALRDPARPESRIGDRRDAPVAFLFSGQGSQYAGMGRGLYESEPTFREALDRCADALRDQLGVDLRDALYPADPGSGAGERLQQTRLTQPALFAVEYALARLWISWGVEPSAMIGHSIGEYAAAHLAGVFSLEDALALVAERGRLMQSMPSGAMLAVGVPEATLRERLGADLDVASVNAPSACVAAGPEEAVARLQQELEGEGIVARRLRTSHAFHSVMMEPIVEPFVERVARLRLGRPSLPFVSNVTGSWISPEQATDPRYWGRHLRSGVRFSEGIRRLRERGDPLLLEVGPGSTLISLARQNADDRHPPVGVPSLRHPQVECDDRQALLGAFGALWLAGAAVDWPKVHAGERRRRVTLPGYPFESRRHWVDRNEEQRDRSNVAAGYSTRRQPLEDWFYQLSWRRALPAELVGRHEFPAQGSRWVVFADDCGLADALAERLGSAGQEVTLVRPGERFARAEGGYQLDPREQGDYQRLVAALDPARGRSYFVHLWGVTADSPPVPTSERLERTQERGFFSLLYLAKALCAAEVTRRIAIAVVTNGMQDVVGGELTCPEKATVIGACRVIPQELKNVRVHSIDVSRPEPGSPDAEWLARCIINELLTRPREWIVAYRARHRWIQWLEPTPLPELQGAPPLRDGGVYLITGGLGGIGLALAEHLAKAHRARLVLSGRSELPPREEWSAWLESHPGEDATSRRIRRIADLESAGAEVLYVAADVASGEAAQELLRRARERFGQVHGVIHAAGVAGGGIIPLKERRAAEAVMAPKLQGTLALDAALGGEPADFLVLCSSTAALSGGLGQIDYCGANAFLDAYARCPRPGSSARAISINWDAWREVGMAVETPVSGALKRQRELSLKLGIAPGEGVEAFLRVLASGLPHVTTFTMDVRPSLLNRFFKPYARETAAWAEGEDAESPDQAPARPAAGVETPVAGLSGDVERAIAAAWAKVLGRSEVGADANFFELGGDSLTALQAISILKARLGREVPVVLFYEAPTVGLLAKALDGAAREPKQAALKDVERRAGTRLERMRRRRRSSPQAAFDGSR